MMGKNKEKTDAKLQRQKKDAVETPFNGNIFIYKSTN